MRPRRLLRRIPTHEACLFVIPRLNGKESDLACAALNSPRLETPLSKHYTTPTLHMSTGTPSGVEDEELIVALAAMRQLLP